MVLNLFLFRYTKAEALQICIKTIKSCVNSSQDSIEYSYKHFISNHSDAEKKGKENQHCFYQSSTYRRDKEYVLTKNKESRKH